MMPNRKTVRFVIVSLVVIAAMVVSWSKYQSHKELESKIWWLHTSLDNGCVMFDRATSWVDWKKIVDVDNYYISDVGPDEQKKQAEIIEKWEECRDSAFARLASGVVGGESTTDDSQSSDAELTAEGRTCAQQWSRAHTETMSGGDQDLQLRATLYACDSVEDWTTEAINNGEWSDYLQMVACALEAGAPKRICG